MSLRKEKIEEIIEAFKQLTDKEKMYLILRLQHDEVSKMLDK